MLRFPASSYESAREPYPAPQRLARDWSAFPLPAGEKGATIWWPEATSVEGEKFWLRVAVATDVREIVRISVSSAESGRPLGEFDLRFSHVFQVHEIPVSPELAALAVREGIVLRRTEGENPIWLFWNSPSGDPGEAFHPHLLSASGAAGDEADALNRLATLDSLQPLGWLEGCVMDGLLAQYLQSGEARFAAALRLHFARFSDDAGRLIYENPRNLPADGRIYGEEGPLPFAVIAQFQPDSPWLDIAAEYFEKWTAHLREGVPQRKNVCESSYTCAYPLAALAKARPGCDWDRFAARHLLNQRNILADSGGVWLRRGHDGSGTEYRNWARAHAWYLLGLARSLPLLAHRPEAGELIEEFIRASKWVAPHQRPDGLWSVFVDEPDLVADTSGTAGIATAFAIGAREGWLDAGFATAAVRTREALRDFLTPDGFLRGVSQGNKGGDALQRGPLRVMPQFALGLYGQLLAETS